MGWVVDPSLPQYRQGNALLAENAIRAIELLLGDAVKPASETINKVAIISHASQKRLAVVDKSILRESSPVFDSMLGVMMTESCSDEIVLGREGAREASLLAFISFMYIGHPSPAICGTFDAMEVWMLAHMYDVKGVKDWLADNCINHATLCAATHFACSVASQEDVCPKLLDCCYDFARHISPNRITLDMLKGVCPAAADKLVEFFSKDGSLASKDSIAWFVTRWMDANEDLVLQKHFDEMPCPQGPIHAEIMGRLSDSSLRDSGIIPAGMELFVKGLGQTLYFRDVDCFQDASVLFKLVEERLQITNPRFLRLLHAGKDIYPGKSLVRQGITTNLATLHSTGRMGSGGWTLEN